MKNTMTLSEKIKWKNVAITRALHQNDENVAKLLNLEITILNDRVEVGNKSLAVIEFFKDHINPEAAKSHAVLQAAAIIGRDFS